MRLNQGVFGGVKKRHDFKEVGVLHAHCICTKYSYPLFACLGNNARKPVVFIFIKILPYARRIGESTVSKYRLGRFFSCSSFNTIAKNRLSYPTTAFFCYKTKELMVFLAVKGCSCKFSHLFLV